MDKLESLAKTLVWAGHTVLKPFIMILIDSLCGAWLFITTGSFLGFVDFSFLVQSEEIKGWIEAVFIYIAWMGFFVWLYFKIKEAYYKQRNKK